MFERASQVNARFVAGSCRQEDVVAALRGLGLTQGQITVLEPTPPSADQVPAEAGGLVARLRAMFGMAAPSAAPPPKTPDIQFIIHMGQNDALASPVQDIFRRFGAVGIEHFAPTSTPQRDFGPPPGSASR